MLLVGQYGLMRWKRGQGPLWGSRGSHLARSAWEKISQVQQAPLPPARTLGTCLRTSASLGTARSLIPMVSLAEVTQCTLTVKQCVIAVVKVSESKEMFPARHLFPFSICAFVKNLLGHLVANKKEILNLTLFKGYGFQLLCFTIEKLREWSPMLINLSFRILTRVVFHYYDLENLLNKWNRKSELLKIAFGSQQK